ncbi:MAG: hypothetical protein U0350_01495 [Caldilineaceae bacterium]
MKIFKNGLLFTITTIVVIYLLLWAVRAFGFRSPLFAFLLNWLVMSWTATSSLALPISFAPSYYALKPFEQDGQLYERLGIRLFKRMIRRGPLAIFSLNMRLPKAKSGPAMRKLESDMRGAETIHVCIFLLMFLFIGYALCRGWLDAAAWLLLFDLLLNVYPVMLQRYNRIWLQELIRQQEQADKALA